MQQSRQCGAMRTTATATKATTKANVWNKTTDLARRSLVVKTAFTDSANGNALEICDVPQRGTPSCEPCRPWREYRPNEHEPDRESRPAVSKSTSLKVL